MYFCLFAENKYDVLSLFWCFILLSVQPKVSFTKSRILDVSWDFEKLFSFFSFLKSVKYKFIESLCKKMKDVIHASNLLWYARHKRKRETEEELCFSVVSLWVWRRRKRRTRIDMDVNRSRYLQKWWARCAVLYLSSQILKTACEGDVNYRSS